MVTIRRTAAIALGKTGEAIAFANQIAKHLKEKYSTTLELLMPVGVNPARIAWRMGFESLAQWEALVGKIMADADYTVAKNSATFLPGSVHDDIWRTL
jgi:hypothetical protein